VIFNFNFSLIKRCPKMTSVIAPQYPLLVGRGTPYKRCWTAARGHGFTVEPDFPETPNHSASSDDPAGSGAAWTMTLDAGGGECANEGGAVARAAAIAACRDLNARTWRVVAPEMRVEGSADPITAPGKYPVFVARSCIPPGFGQALAREMAALQEQHAWSLYHSSEEGQGEWNRDGMGKGANSANGVDRARRGGGTSARGGGGGGGETAEGAAAAAAGAAAGRGLSLEEGKTEVRVLYGAHRCDASALPFQNPCGVKHQWSHAGILKDPYIEMPPVCRMLRDFLVMGNPAVVSAFGDIGMGADYLGLAAFTEYRHKNSLVSSGGKPGESGASGKPCEPDKLSGSSTAALAWHYDKSLGIETACISLPITMTSGAQQNSPRTIGHKTIGLGGRNPVPGACGQNIPGAFTTMPMPVNSFWCANAKAIYHAVGNDDERSATIVLRTLVPKQVYEELFFHRGARHVTRLVRKVELRYFPVLEEADVDAARALLESSRATVE
jgi:hypothetical protein